METKVSERKVIIVTAFFIVLAGLVKLVNYKIGIVFFYLAFVPYLVYRFNYHYKLRGKQKTQVDKYRFMVLAAMLVTILLNVLGIQDVEFFLLFLLMVDFLIVINRKT